MNMFTCYSFVALTQEDLEFVEEAEWVWEEDLREATTFGSVLFKGV